MVAILGVLVAETAAAGAQLSGVCHWFTVPEGEEHHVANANDELLQFPCDEVNDEVFACGKRSQSFQKLMCWPASRSSGRGTAKQHDSSAPTDESGKTTSKSVAGTTPSSPPSAPPSSPPSAPPSAPQGTSKSVAGTLRGKGKSVRLDSTAGVQPSASVLLTSEKGATQTGGGSRSPKETRTSTGDSSTASTEAQTSPRPNRQAFGTKGKTLARGGQPLAIAKNGRSDVV